MSFHERSLDDLPLAAYTTGVVPKEDEERVPVAPVWTPAPAIDSDDPNAHTAATDAAAPPAVKPGGRTWPRLSIRMPRLRRSKTTAIEQAAPFQPVNPPEEEPGAFQPVHGFADTVPVGTWTPPARAGSAPRDPRAILRDPRAILRDPRALAGGTIVIGLVLLGISLLGGGSTNGTGGPNSSQGAGGLGPSPAPMGIASVELTGGISNLVTYSLTASTGAGPAVGSQLDATWTDPLGQSLGLVGLASQGTRTTDADFVLSWTMLINNQTVTFTSRDSECTIGMAVGAKAVHGTFVCKKLRSSDGDHVIDLNGDYTT